MSIASVDGGKIWLPHKPSAPLSIRFFRGRGPISTTHLLIFLNGLIIGRTGWDPIIENLLQRWQGTNGLTMRRAARDPAMESLFQMIEAHNSDANYPSLLAYDRFGQGESAPDPADTGNGHDMHEVVRDLHRLAQSIQAISHRSPSQDDSDSAAAAAQPEPRLIFVAHSFGCPIGRLYAETYPGTVSALLFLDSNMANSDLVSVFPDPDAPDFDPATDLPPDVSEAQLCDTRAKYAAMFHPSVRNPENLDRRNVAALLPHADRPVLVGPGPEGAGGPLVGVVEHDWDVFAEEGLRGSLGTPKSLTNRYMNPAWRRYNEGLVLLTNVGRGEGPVTAKGCGHFIQRDDPVLVADLVDGLVAKVIS